MACFLLFKAGDIFWWRTTFLIIIKLDLFILVVRKFNFNTVVILKPIDYCKFSTINMSFKLRYNYCRAVAINSFLHQLIRLPSHNIVTRITHKPKKKSGMNLFLKWRIQIGKKPHLAESVKISSSSNISYYSTPVNSSIVEKFMLHIFLKKYLKFYACRLEVIWISY